MSNAPDGNDAALIAELAKALCECADRFESCCVHSGSDPEFAAIAVEDYRALIAKAEAK